MQRIPSELRVCPMPFLREIVYSILNAFPKTSLLKRDEAFGFLAFEI